VVCAEVKTITGWPLSEKRGKRAAALGVLTVLVFADTRYFCGVAGEPREKLTAASEGHGN